MTKCLRNQAKANHWKTLGEILTKYKTTECMNGKSPFKLEEWKIPRRFGSPR